MKFLSFFAYTKPYKPAILTLLRVALGVIIFIKGIGFLQETAILEDKLHFVGEGSQSELAQIITWMHLLGGFMIATGLLTRFAAVMQVPILAGAVFMVNIKEGFITGNTELWLSLVILIGLFIFVVKGSGVISSDQYFKSYYRLGSSASKSNPGKKELDIVR